MERRKKRREGGMNERGMGGRKGGRNLGRNMVIQKIEEWRKGRKTSKGGSLKKSIFGYC